MDPDLIIPNRKLSILEGAITASGWNNIKGDSISRMYFEALSKKYGLSLIHIYYGIAVYPIVTVREIIAFLHNRELDGRVYIDDEMKGRMEAYLEQYGAR